MLAGNRCNSILQPNLASTNVKSKAGLKREGDGGKKIHSSYKVRTDNFAGDRQSSTSSFSQREKIMRS